MILEGKGKKENALFMIFTGDNQPLLCWIPCEKIEGVELELHYQPLPPAVHHVDQNHGHADQE